MNLCSKIIIVFLILIPSLLHAGDYDEHAKAVRREVWSWEQPEFSNYVVPEEYKNESVVILARRNEINVSNKNKFNVNAILWATGPSHVTKLYYTDIERFMVKINDVKALEEYSELSFREEFKKRQYYTNKAKTIVGARIIKPDGSIKEVNVADESVTITEGKKDEGRYKKLAIPDLLMGDILDYFYCTELELEDMNVPLLTFNFYGTHPTLDYSICCEIGKKLTVEYRSINGAPEMQETKTNEESTTLEVHKKNLPKIEETRWLSPLRDLAMIRMMILNNESKIIYKPASARKSGIYKDIPKETILNDAKGYLARIERGTKVTWKQLANDVKKDVKNYQLKFPDTNNEDLASYLYDDLYFQWMSHYSRSDLSSEKLFILLGELLKEYSIEYRLGFVTSKYGARPDEIITPEDLSYIMIANNGKQVFYPPYGYGMSDDRSANFQGEIASTIRIEKFSAGKPEGITGITEEYQIPETTAEQNKNIVISEVSFLPENPLLLLIHKNTIWTGDLKSDFQTLLILYEDWDTAMRKRLFIEKSFMQEMEENKNDRKYVDDYRTLFDEKRKEQKDNMKLEVQGFYDKEINELQDYSIESSGITAENPELKYNVTYVMNDFVKKAGDNLILDAGKLIGTQWVPSENERKRVVNAYLPTARSFINEIRIQIPQDYEIQSIDKLNYKIGNKYALFESVARIEDNEYLVIQTQKVYHKAFVPVDHWNLLLEIIDRTNEFSGQSIVLKKR